MGRIKKTYWQVGPLGNSRTIETYIGSIAVRSISVQKLKNDIVDRANVSLYYAPKDLNEAWYEIYDNPDNEDRMDLDFIRLIINEIEYQENVGIPTTYSGALS